MEIKVDDIKSCKAIVNKKGIARIQVEFSEANGTIWKTKAISNLSVGSEIDENYLSQPGRGRGRDIQKRKVRYDRNKFYPGFRTGQNYIDPDDIPKDEF